MKKLTLYRRRLIPDECILLKDDVILQCDDDKIITSWNTFRPKQDFDHGTSVYYLQKGIKVSKFLRSDGSLAFWYCDIVHYQYGSSGSASYADGSSEPSVDCVASISSGIEPCTDCVAHTDNINETPANHMTCTACSSQAPANNTAFAHPSSDPREYDSLTCVDLLADVIIFPDGFVKVVDLDELVDAAERSLISEQTLHSVLLRVNDLLQVIYRGEFANLTAPLDSF